METVNKTKLNNFLKKFDGVTFNDDNYSIGGGLVGGMSNRNHDAKHDAGKLTLDQAAKKIADIFALDKGLVKSIIDREFELEWHHAGFLPKSYGGGMRKVYYVNSEQMVYVAKNIQHLLKKESDRIEQEITAVENRVNRELSKAEFAKEFGKVFTRVTKTPDHAVVTLQEMKGKYGWFDSRHKRYNLLEYYSGVAFESADLKDKYLAL
jgi:hypothetical protein